MLFDTFMGGVLILTLGVGELNLDTKKEIRYSVTLGMRRVICNKHPSAARMCSGVSWDDAMTALYEAIEF